jgi:hypothetical protein
MQIQNLEPYKSPSIRQMLANHRARGETTRATDGGYCATNSVPLQQFLAGKAQSAPSAERQNPRWTGGMGFGRER